MAMETPDYQPATIQALNDDRQHTGPHLDGLIPAPLEQEHLLRAEFRE